jgi:hypothetical protein
MICAVVFAVSGSAQGLTDPPLHISVSGSDSSNCTAVAPCASLARAFLISRPGQVVLIGPGAYPSQTIAARDLPGPAVVFRSATKIRPQIQQLRVFGSHLEFQNVKFGEWTVQDPAAHVTFRNASTGRFTIASAHFISIIGGTAGPFHDTSNNIGPSDLTTRVPPSNVLIDGVTFHDFTKRTEGAHVDCLHSWGVTGLIVRNSRFVHCEHFDILLDGGAAAGLPRNVTIENNFLDCCVSGYFAVYLGVPGPRQSWSNVLVRNNSSNKDMGIDPGAGVAGRVSFLSNIAPRFQGCRRTGVTADYNVWFAGARCGRHDLVRPPGYVDATRYDFHLGRTAAAIDHGDPHSYPRADIDGQKRPLGPRPDAGADEAR